MIFAGLCVNEESSWHTQQMNTTRPNKKNSGVIKLVFEDDTVLPVRWDIALKMPRVFKMINEKIVSHDEDGTVMVRIGEECTHQGVGSVVHFINLGDAVNDTATTIEEEIFTPLTQRISEYHARMIDIPAQELAELMETAMWLEVKEVATLCAKRIAEMIRGMSHDHIRALFGLNGDGGFDDAQREQFNDEDQWFGVN